MKFDSRSVELSWSPPLHSHYSEVQHYTIHILQGEDADWASHQVINLINVYRWRNLVLNKKQDYERMLELILVFYMGSMKFIALSIR